MILESHRAADEIIRRSPAILDVSECPAACRCAPSTTDVFVHPDDAVRRERPCREAGSTVTSLPLFCTRSVRVLMALRPLSTGKNLVIYNLLSAVLVVAWLLGFSIFRVGGGSIHGLLVLAILVLLWGLVAPRAAVAVGGRSARER
jgi:hypothetical protein